MTTARSDVSAIVQREPRAELGITVRPGLLLLLLVAAFVLRIGWQLASRFYIRPETWEYDAVARNILAGYGYVYHYFGSDWQTFATPAYPALLVLLHWLGGGVDGYVLVGLAQAALSAALSAVSYLIAAKLVDRRAGLVAAAIVAIHPGLVIYSAKVHELTFEALLAGLLLVSVLDAVRSGVGLGL